MALPSNAYPKALRARIVKAALAGKTIKELAEAHHNKPSAASIRAWVNEAKGITLPWKDRPKRDRTRRRSKVAALPEPLRELERNERLLGAAAMVKEIEQIRQERDYLRSVVLPWVVLKLAPSPPT